MVEVRGHARGGQGMVTAFEILAKIFSQLGDFQVQAFPAFGVERTGAPIQGFLRVSKDEIFNRSNIYSPHLIVVFDETLIDQIPVFDGLRENGTILLNTERDPSEFSEQANNIFTVPATKISFSKGLGSKSLPIVNAAMIGAIMRIFNADIRLAAKIISENVPAKPKQNAESAKIAYESINQAEKTEFVLASQLLEDELLQDKDKTNSKDKGTKTAVAEAPLTPAWDKPMSLNKTGNWKVLIPRYETRQAPCVASCPAGTDVRLFVHLTSEGKFKEAYDTIYEYNPFAGTCGRVCPHFCQQNCNRTELDEELNISAIERFLGDYGIQQPVEPVEVKYEEKIAIVGSGPAGLTAALRLRQKGYETTVFEALGYAGGMMRTGIPEFRLPQNILDQEIEKIVKEGVEIKLNSRVTVQDLEKDFSVVVVATGSHIGTKMRIPNEELALEGITFLRDFKLNGKASEINKNDKVMIIGGGNTAIDVARTALRLGAEPIIHYRRTKNEMPAIPHEVDEAEAEGVQIEFLSAPIAIEKSANGSLNVTIIKMELGEPDESGRRRPVPIKGSETVYEVNKMITAVGQWYDNYVFSGEDVKPIQGKTEYKANIPVFCSGDMAWGGTVTEAIGSGNSVAQEVHAFLQGKVFDSNQVEENIVYSSDINYAYYLPTPSHHNPMRKDVQLEGDFTEVVSGLSEQQVLEEANRCLHCGECYNCGNCYNNCPDAAVFLDDDNRLRIDYNYCKGCGICYEECPCSAISFSMEEVTHE